MKYVFIYSIWYTCSFYIVHIHVTHITYINLNTHASHRTTLLILVKSLWQLFCFCHCCSWLFSTCRNTKLSPIPIVDLLRIVFFPFSFICLNWISFIMKNHDNFTIFFLYLSLSLFFFYFCLSFSLRLVYFRALLFLCLLFFRRLVCRCSNSIHRYRHQDEDLLPNADTFTLSPHRIKCHHPNCPKTNLNTSIMDGGKARHLKSQMADTNSISGTIAIPNNNCNNSQLSSPDMSEANEIMHRHSSSSVNLATMANSGNDGKDDKHKSSLLKIPGVIKMEQQSVGWIFYLLFSSSLAWVWMCMRSIFSALAICFPKREKIKLSLISHVKWKHNPSLQCVYLNIFDFHFSFSLSPFLLFFFFFSCHNKINGFIKHEQQCTNGSGEYLSPPSSARRRSSSVMFNEYVILHKPPNVSEAQTNKNISQVEKTTQAGDGNIWKVNAIK